MFLVEEINDRCKAVQSSPKEHHLHLVDASALIHRRTAVLGSECCRQTAQVMTVIYMISQTTRTYHCSSAYLTMPMLHVRERKRHIHWL